MKSRIHFGILFPFIAFILMGFGDHSSSLRKNSSRVECAMDIFAQNDISVTVDYVTFSSSSDTKTFYNIAGNGASDSGVFYWETTEGFTITIKLGSSSGTGRIRVVAGRTQVHCSNFNNPTLAFVIEINPSECVGGYFVISNHRVANMNMQLFNFFS